MIASADVTNDANVDVAEREDVAGAVSDVQGLEPDGEGEEDAAAKTEPVVEAHKCMYNMDNFLILTFYCSKMGNQVFWPGCKRLSVAAGTPLSSVLCRIVVHVRCFVWYPCCFCILVGVFVSWEKRSCFFSCDCF